jgi:hypothetical protein
MFGYERGIGKFILSVLQEQDRERRNMGREPVHGRDGVTYFVTGPSAEAGVRLVITIEVWPTERG